MSQEQYRIVSLIPSATEIVDYLGFGDQLVGRSHECDFPLNVEALPALTQPRFDPNGDSRQIDERVKDVLREALSVYWVDEGKLSELAPTHIITQAQCDVCAVNLEDVQRAVSACGLTDARVISLEPMTLDDIYADVGRVAEALNLPDSGAARVAELRTRAEAICREAESLTHKPTAACIEWIEPLMAAGNWVPELVRMAGGVDWFGVPGAHSPWIDWDSIWAHDPDMIVLMPCGFGIERTLAEMPPLTRHPGWDTLRAVKAGHVYITDGNHFFNRPGPRVIESLEILAEIFHPDIFDFGHRGTGWIQYSTGK